jgi:signal transduction histidine kinase
MLQKITVALALALALGVLGYLTRQTQIEPLDLGLYSSRVETLRRISEVEADLERELATARLNLDADWTRLGKLGQQILALEQTAATGQSSVIGIDAGIDASLHNFLAATDQKMQLAQDSQQQLRDLISRFKDLRESAAHILAVVLPTQSSALRQQIGDLLDAATTYTVESVPANGEALDSSMQTIQSNAQTLEPSARAALLAFTESARQLRASRDALQLQTKRMAEVPLPQSLQSLLADYSEHYRAQEASVSRYRMILAIYAASLLLVFAVLGLRLRGSFLELDGINAQLQDTNANLENMVASRTQELSKALDDLRMNEAHLIQSEKMASLGQMVAGLAHEINTPLAYVRSNVETVRGSLGGLRRVAGAHPDAEESFSESDSLLADADYGLGQIADLVMGLKNFARVDRSQSELFDVNEGLDTAIKICGNQLKNRIQVEREYADLPRIHGAPSQINQVFLNILTNSAQAIEGEGQIQVRTRDAGAHVEISIRDSGCGMDAQTRAHIFEPFFTTKDVGQGTGLGLAIVFRIVEDHRGSIRVESAPGEGTEFIICLPKAGSPRGAAQESGTAAVSDPSFSATA